MSKTETDSLLRSGHRDRLRQKFLDDKLADYEVLELLLSYAIPRKDVRPLARMLFKKFGDMFNILCASMDSLCSVPGVGRNTAIFIKTVHHVLIKGHEGHAKDSIVFQNEGNLRNYCRLMLGGKPTEELHVLYLDADGRMIENELHSHGTVNETVLFDSEIIKHAILIEARMIVLVHNHPRAGRSFSSEDQQLTEEFGRKLTAVGMRLYDHYVVSGNVVYSMRDMGLLKKREMTAPVTIEHAA